MESEKKRVEYPDNYTEESLENQDTGKLSMLVKEYEREHAEINMLYASPSRIKHRMIMRIGVLIAVSIFIIAMVIILLRN